jgi:hypothetical protein
MSAQAAAVFPDTNVFLHYRAINEVDWCALVKARPVQIMIAPMVPRELEEQRIVHPVRKVRDRATSAIKLPHKYIAETQVRDGVTLQFRLRND